jgi:hypothetical protein
VADASRRADQRAEGWAGAVQETAQGAAQKATEGAANVQNRLRAVDETVQDYTGKPLQQWTEDLKSLMREKPLMAQLSWSVWASPLGSSYAAER